MPVASPGFGVKRGTKLSENTHTHTYYEIHAVNSDKAIDLYSILLDRQPHEVECQSLCGFEVIKKLSSWKSRGHVPQCPIAGDANG